MNNFKQIRLEDHLKNLNITTPEWRHNFVYKKVGSLYTCGGGEITITLPNNQSYTVKTKNLAKRLDKLISNLMSPTIKVNDRWIENYKQSNSPLTIEDVENLEIKIKFLD